MKKNSTARKARVGAAPIARRVPTETHRLQNSNDSTASNACNLVFPRQSGAYRQLGNMLGARYDGHSKKVGNYWQEVLKQAGIKRRVRWHDLRHTAATLLLTGAWGHKWSIEEVRDMLGHSDIKVTQRYTHALGTLADGAARETARVLEMMPKRTRNAAPPAEIESATNGLGNRCSIH